MIPGASAGGKGTWCCRQAARCACGAERIEQFRKLLEMTERYKHVNQYQ